MAVELPEPPLYDDIVHPKNNPWKLTRFWNLWFTSLKNYLNSYFSSSGFIIPRITLQQRNQITIDNAEVIMVFITDDNGTPLNELQVRINGVWMVVDFV